MVGAETRPNIARHVPDMEYTAGHTYQVQIKANLTSSWNDFGAPRFAAGTSDSIYVGGNPASYFRIQLRR